MKDISEMKEGRWFCCWAWWLLPKKMAKSPLFLRKTLRELNAKQKAIDRANRATDRAQQAFEKATDRTRRAKAEACSEALKRQFRSSAEYQTTLYNSQPDWSLHHIETTSLSEACQIITEFVESVRFTSAEYCWPLSYPTGRVEWKKHGWKHVDFEALKSFVEDLKSGWEPPPQIKAELIGSTEKVQEFFRRAAQRDPQAVARVDYLFPKEEEKRAIVQDFFSPQEKLQQIPSAAELAAELADVAVRFPDSPEGEEARRALQVLVSKKAVKGAPPQGGRPRISYPREVVLLAYKMSYTLCKQLREVGRFLNKCEPSWEKRQSLLLQFYPWVNDPLRLVLLDLLQTAPSQGACQIVASMLGFSDSTVRKVLDQHRHLL